MTVGKEQVSIFDMSKAQSMDTGVSRADIHRAEQAAAKTEDKKIAEDGEEKPEQELPAESEE